VTNEVWKAAGLPPDALCCLACLEHRLDRPLTITDFTPCLINRLAFAAAGKLHVIMEDEARREEVFRRMMEEEPALWRLEREK
jgi:hypothetical protein